MNYNYNYENGYDYCSTIEFSSKRASQTELLRHRTRIHVGVLMPLFQHYQNRRSGPPSHKIIASSRMPAHPGPWSKFTSFVLSPVTE
jgi:hypothetical protein